MSDIPSSTEPRSGGAITLPTVPGSLERGAANGSPGGLSALLRTWLRGSLGSKPDSDWRETIEELIEEPGGPEALAAADQERVMLGNILRLRDRTVYDVMIPRADIVALDIETPADEAVAKIAEHAHSRIPVFRGSLDDVLGMVHLKDLFSHLARKTDFTLEALVRPVTVIAPSMPVIDLLLQMRADRQHLALVVDEYGGIDGLVTIEDLVEEIVGEIEDEHENGREPELVARPDGTYMVDARYPLEDFEKLFGAIDREEIGEDVDTIGGLVFSLTGRVPARGEIVRCDPLVEFEVVDGDPRRIRRLRLRRLSAEEVEALGGGEG